MPRISSDGWVVDAIAVARARTLLINAQQPLIEWLGREECQRIVLAMIRSLSGEHHVAGLLYWLSESENIQSVFRHTRAFIAGNTTRAEGSAPDISVEDCKRVREALLRSINQVVEWIEDELNAGRLLSVLREVGETIDMSVIVERLERDTRSDNRLAQRTFQNIRLLMPGGRPNSGLSGFAGLAARGSFA